MLFRSQTCDVQSDPQTGFARKPILIARIKPIGHVYPKLKFDSPKNCVSSVKSLATAGSSPSTFYLPAFQVEAFTFERAVTNLLDVQRFDPKDLQALTRQIRLRLTQTALQALQERCAYSFGRFGTPDDLYYSAKEWAEIQRLEEERRRNQGSA